MKLFLSVFIFFALVSCSNEIHNKPIKEIIPNENKLISNEVLKVWHLADPVLDSIPGISLKRALSLVKNHESKLINVAVIDATLDINHEDLKNTIWNNPKEKINKIDDEKNGYIDDIHGWNFIGNSSGSLPIYENFEVVRIVRFFNEFFISNDSLAKENLKKHNVYIQAKNKLNKKQISLKKIIEKGEPFIDNYYRSLNSIKPFLNDEELSLPLLEKLLEKNKNLENEIKSVMIPLQYDMVISDLEKDLDFQKRLLNIYYNTSFDERMEIGDNPNDINDTSYGNNIVGGLKDTISHGTNVAGIIAANSNNKIGIQGILKNVKIIPIVVAVNGEAHDKDLALAIRYAVDNGANIINISISKEFSLHKKWVFDAIKYAASNDVLIVAAAGNDNFNLDLKKNFYPNDSDYENPEFSDNFIMAGGINHTIGNNLKYSSSNYGQETVDIMAPAENIYTTSSNNSYEFVDGTSFAAPIVSAVAGLIRSYYPSLRASEVKFIIMQSGIPYAGDVNVADEGEEEQQVPFSSLSKSGKIINAYNALLLADKIASKKSK